MKYFKLWFILLKEIFKIPCKYWDFKNYKYVLQNSIILFYYYKGDIRVFYKMTLEIINEHNSQFQLFFPTLLTTFCNILIKNKNTYFTLVVRVFKSMINHIDKIRFSDMFSVLLKNKLISLFLVEAILLNILAPPKFFFKLNWYIPVCNCKWFADTTTEKFDWRM